MPYGERAKIAIETVVRVLDIHLLDLTGRNTYSNSVRLQLQNFYRYYLREKILAVNRRSFSLYMTGDHPIRSVMSNDVLNPRDLPTSSQGLFALLAVLQIADDTIRNDSLLGFFGTSTYHSWLISLLQSIRNGSYNTIMNGQQFRVYNATGTRIEANAGSSNGWIDPSGSTPGQQAVNNWESTPVREDIVNALGGVINDVMFFLMEQKPNVYRALVNDYGSDDQMRDVCWVKLILDQRFIEACIELYGNTSKPTYGVAIIFAAIDMFQRNGYQLYDTSKYNLFLLTNTGYRNNTEIDIIADTFLNNNRIGNMLILRHSAAITLLQELFAELATYLETHPATLTTTDKRTLRAVLFQYAQNRCNILNQATLKNLSPITNDHVNGMLDELLNHFNFSLTGTDRVTEFTRVCADAMNIYMGEMGNFGRTYETGSASYRLLREQAHRNGDAVRLRLAINNSDIDPNDVISFSATYYPGLGGEDGHWAYNIKTNDNNFDYARMEEEKQAAFSGQNPEYYHNRGYQVGQRTSYHFNTHWKDSDRRKIAKLIIAKYRQIIITDPDRDVPANREKYIEDLRKELKFFHILAECSKSLGYSGCLIHSNDERIFLFPEYKFTLEREAFLDSTAPETTWLRHTAQILAQVDGIIQEKDFYGITLYTDYLNHSEPSYAFTSYNNTTNNAGSVILNFRNKPAASRVLAEEMGWMANDDDYWNNASNYPVNIRLGIRPFLIELSQILSATMIDFDVDVNNNYRKMDRLISTIFALQAVKNLSQRWLDSRILDQSLRRVIISIMNDYLKSRINNQNSHLSDKYELFSGFSLMLRSETTSHQESLDPVTNLPNLSPYNGNAFGRLTNTGGARTVEIKKYFKNLAQSDENTREMLVRELRFMRSDGKNLNSFMKLFSSKKDRVDAVAQYGNMQRLIDDFVANGLSESKYSIINRFQILLRIIDDEITANNGKVPTSPSANVKNIITLIATPNVSLKALIPVNGVSEDLAKWITNISVVHF